MNKTTFINLTPHTVNEVESGQAFPPSGEVARVSTTNEVVGEAGGVNLYATSYGDVVGLPAPQDGTMYVVSGLVRAAVPERHDVVSPGALVRNEAGQPTGCSGFVVNV